MSFPPNSPGSHTVLQAKEASSLWLNKLKIVGSGQNWSVAPCEPFYLLGTEPSTSVDKLTGENNLIELYGLETAYKKFCGRVLRDELSAFLPHLSGNVNMPAFEDGSGLLGLIERPPITGKELLPFAPSQLDHGFRLHPGPLPQEYISLFMAPQTINNSSNDHSNNITPGISSTAPQFPSKLVSGTSSQPLQVSSNRLSGYQNNGPNALGNLRKQRREVHKSFQLATSNGSGSIPTSCTPSSVGFTGGGIQPGYHSNPANALHGNQATPISAYPRHTAVSRSINQHANPAVISSLSQLPRNEPMPNLQPVNCLPPPSFTSAQHITAPVLSVSKSILHNPIASTASTTHMPPLSFSQQQSLGQTLSGPPDLKKARRFDDQTEFLSSEKAGQVDHFCGEEEKRKKKRKEKKYRKEKE